MNGHKFVLYGYNMKRCMSIIFIIIGRVVCIYRESVLRIGESHVVVYNCNIYTGG